MIDTPDAPPGDVEAGADSGHDENGSAEPQNPVAATSSGEDTELEAAEDSSAGEEVVAQDLDGEAVGLEAAQAQGVALQAPATPPEDPAVLELRTQVAELTQSLAATQRRADELATVARKQTEMADELHADNRRLRGGEIREAVAPLVRGLARLADDLSRMRATATAAAEDLAYLDGQVAELLHDAGVLKVQAQIGEPFDPQCHQATGSATTADSALNRTIAEVRRAGLRRDDGRMLRPVDVVVFRYVAPAPPAAQPATEEVT
ncbi:MAG: molecular chaperone GrpE [Solirubrobacteraceae bacterium]|nr:molecular chaperone GrpE [Solirubrobacteraceae bacterium]